MNGLLVKTALLLAFVCLASSLPSPIMTASGPGAPSVVANAWQNNVVPAAAAQAKAEAKATSPAKAKATSPAVSDFLTKFSNPGSAVKAAKPATTVPAQQQQQPATIKQPIQQPPQPATPMQAIGAAVTMGTKKDALGAK